MQKGELFGALVEYHIQENLQSALSHIKDGRLRGLYGRLLKEGSDKGQLYEGVLIVANGATLMDRLVEDEVILSKPQPFTHLENKRDFFAYLTSQDDSDGAYVFDGVNQRITKASEFNNNPPLPAPVEYSSLVPADFLSFAGDVDVHDDSKYGTKTRLAMKIPQAYQNTDTFQIKRSAYGPLGMGKVTHFNRQGVVEEFFFQYEPLSQRINGVYRSYSRNEVGQLMRQSERHSEVLRLQPSVYSMPREALVA